MINDDLIRALPPPAAPGMIPSDADFALLETQLGSRLPSDYLQFWKLYGAGAISEFLGILRPVGPPPHYGTVPFALDHLRIMVPTPRTNWDVYPATAGLIPWGQTDNGDMLAWTTEGYPDAWTVAVVPPRESDVDLYSVSMTTFLARWVLGQLVVKSFPDDVKHGFVARRT